MGERTPRPPGAVLGRSRGPASRGTPDDTEQMPRTLPAPDKAAALWAAASEATYNNEAAKLCCVLSKHPSKLGSVLIYV